MRQLMGLTYAYLVVLFLSFGFSQSLVPSEIIKARRDSAVQVLVENRPGPYFPVCSGAVVDLGDKKRIVSAAHCFEQGKRYYVRDHTGKVTPVQVERIDTIKDHAILTGVAAQTLPAIPIADELLEIGEVVFVWEAPLSMNPILGIGYYAGKGGSSDDPLAQISLGDRDYVVVNADVGASGSIVMNTDGEAVGILVSGLGPDAKLGGVSLAPMP